jgi:drug/metabolite transporter (DMT)-like permease
MPDPRTTATLIVIATGLLWGLYWLPVRRLGDLGLPGAWGTLAIVAAAAVLLFPFALAASGRLRQADRIGLLSLALGGVAFVIYSAGLQTGRVATVILLFFLTPVWSTLLGRLLMGWPVTPLRLAALAAGFLGLALVLGGGGGAPLPRSPGEWLGLASGIVWALATTGIRARAGIGADPGPGASAFVFALGATLGALLLAPLLAPLPVWPADPARAGLWALAAGGLWWGLTIAGLTWAAARLDPARVGILLMAEVVVGAVSAAWLAGEALTPWVVSGGACVLLAGALEVWPRPGRRTRA